MWGDMVMAMKAETEEGTDVSCERMMMALWLINRLLKAAVLQISDPLYTLPVLFFKIPKK